MYGGIPNGLVHGEASFVIPKPQPDLIIGPYQKGDDSKIFLYPIDTLLVRRNPFWVVWPVNWVGHERRSSNLDRRCLSPVPALSHPCSCQQLCLALAAARHQM